MVQDPKYDLPTYTPTARGLHWLIALLVFIQLPLGFYMSYRGNDMPSVNEKGEPVKGVWDALTGFLYSSHKLIGLTVLVFLMLRLVPGTVVEQMIGADAVVSKEMVEQLKRFFGLDQPWYTQYAAWILAAGHDVWLDVSPSGGSAGTLWRLRGTAAAHPPCRARPLLRGRTFVSSPLLPG